MTGNTEIEQENREGVTRKRRSAQNDGFVEGMTADNVTGCGNFDRSTRARFRHVPLSFRRFRNLPANVSV
jgi:hypothetical protein